jgi:hypothetical protein
VPGLVRCALKTAYRDGTTHVIFEPEDFIARLAALVPKPRAHLIRYHGVFAPASADRARVVPKTRAAADNSKDRGEPLATDRQRSLTWAQRLKRVFAIDIEVCRRCGGKLRVIASIEEPATIERILEHLGRDAVLADRWGRFMRPTDERWVRLRHDGSLDQPMRAAFSSTRRTAPLTQGALYSLSAADLRSGSC